ncbi:Unsaturated rhamnogalacturonyl hydrolase-like protein [Hapsidospora chrysogenum ATCC 11550]|uniref:Unsaturated rhamnogalacturonyl hydrolase-like protein n=1 Tax=Hapsidospora chrysogenum (strain ATCC 11550 / CBS 779.69 / DSM 880 / IAM 14645 / JCM 23072 / IMI 49137) TaxID=857340 RepID=A0A086T4V5_HAPC1|nr:Unsaturated rhamnogalacturonyl hydrolase-like protein [Hapsidospora chrysogenum ATCC 11550]
MRLHNIYSLAAAAQASHALSHRSVTAPNETDWSTRIVESTMERHDYQNIGPWEYTTGLYLLAQYQVYKRTGNPAYLSYIRAWADQFIDDNGNLDLEHGLDSLDSMQSGNIMLVLHDEFHLEEYYNASVQIRNRIDSYPRLDDGAFWHSTQFEHQLWADGTFMVNPFLARFGAAYDDREYTDEETTSQLIAYGKHLVADNGLLQHAYDEARSQPWADPETGLSEEQWCRAMGWYGMAMTDVLQVLQEDHPRREEVLAILQRFVNSVWSYQDPSSGLWFQVVNKPNQEGNWVETSCSAMFIHTISTSVQQGYVDDSSGSLRQVVQRGYAGVLERITVDDEGLTDVHDICVGTGPGDLQWYLERPTETNDLHGLGAVILMNEQIIRSSQE